MKNKIYDVAFSITNFKHTNELIHALDKYSPLMKDDTTMVLRGFYIIVSEIKDDESLQQSTLLQTMLNIKKQYAIRYNFRHTLADISAITLAIAHVKYCLKVKRLRDQEQMESVS